MTELLLDLAGRDLDAGEAPRPTVAAFDRETPLALVMLRPFEAGELVQALLEVLALLLPIGADRLALALPGRAWSLEDPIPPVTDELDLRARVIVLATADGARRPAAISTIVRPFELDATLGWRWQEPIELPEAPVSSALTAVGTLLDARDGVWSESQVADSRLAEQLRRVLVLGHELALAPTGARRLELTAAP